MTTFVERVESYLALRRSLGCRLVGQGKLLLDFGRLLDRRGSSGSITMELALQWAQAPRSKDPDQTARRLGTIRGFLRHSAGVDGATEIPPPALLGRGIRRKPPHIYSQAEVTALLQACGRLRPCDGLRPHTYRTLFGLLLACGLRISEALHLEDADMDLEAGVLTVRAGKLGKTRLVPMHPTVVPPFQSYAMHRDRIVPSGTGFFRTDRGARLSYVAVRGTFIALSRQLGWTAEGRSRRPRIHDMRHSFAVSCLVRWYREGIHADQRIAHLATYLGHVEVRDTYWYISAAPELMALAAERFEHFASRAREISS